LRERRERVLGWAEGESWAAFILPPFLFFSILH
jgi:hypothetical protein